MAPSATRSRRTGWPTRDRGRARWSTARRRRAGSGPARGTGGPSCRPRPGPVAGSARACRRAPRGRPGSCGGSACERGGYAGAPMRPRPAAAVAVLALLAPTALAFADGGFNEGARDVALAVAGGLLVLAAIVLARPRPRGGPTWAALGGLAALTAFTTLSEAWAPQADPAWATAERDALYLAGLLLVTLLLTGADRRLARAAEPLLGVGALVVVGYGLLGRLLPDVVHALPSVSAGGRLDKPLTYWNAMGCLAAPGGILGVRGAGGAAPAPGLRRAAGGAPRPPPARPFPAVSRGAPAGRPPRPP